MSDGVLAKAGTIHWPERLEHVVQLLSDIHFNNAQIQKSLHFHVLLTIRTIAGVEISSFRWPVAPDLRIRTFIRRSNKFPFPEKIDLTDRHANHCISFGDEIYDRVTISILPEYFWFLR